MPLPKFQTLTEQVAAYLRQELQNRRWSGEMPGQKKLATLLGVSGKTVELALILLENDGILVGRGIGQRRQIALPENLDQAQLRVGILTYEKEDRSVDYIGELGASFKSKATYRF
ncbi:MAG: DNA-binding GntR family transcriptional regulator [Cryomorphaceae bacterium]|jgi:DNA-binding GntR family transcriptional regulator